ncbi:MAG TPA: alpha-ketoacid dehydrogenase subunit beta [Polyangiaceae bacterium LLY-WYZ-15_(1-7)]|nr:alpha-ketoacid dehydrogenase subunit beta [Myxococcales bacterium]MAT23880.1 alpha-ketoacid dehydrogenase subunit beta [Sandaracinus sp.]HJK92241.1 alpha-ketoacid dehydrogenase subunit beta [Polyangiaceae bacterium LLY-WYZ-15_(1-7)]MBJ71169.1 alpha-ketoacid dehydrogenase subunit beta [Sandaracinus sp.]HJL00548.1 alpha-ketoacid dehydrogenase subunit beta [Polyangiaceae bacterium LLY-WYZ-15_(1-7)]
MSSYRDAIRSALRQLMQEDERVFLMGEDVGNYGGAYAVSKGLLEEFGPERIRDTPLAESGFVGAGIGAALGGMRPIVEVMTVNFSLLALDQVVNNAATMRHMSGGQFEVPLVVRMATGGGKQIAAQHSHSLENWFAHVPGIKCLAPATVQDARDMVLQAVADPDPVFVFEHQLLYGMTGELDEEAAPADPWRAIVRRPGEDVTLIGWAGTLGKCLEAAEALAKEGVEAEVVDLRCLRPIDFPTLAASVTKTHRAVIVDEGWKTGGLAGELMAGLMERVFYELDGPIRRVCTAEVPIPYAKHMEDHALPTVERVVAAAKESLRG